MPTKPIVQPEYWATDAVYTTGPFIGQPQKVVPPGAFGAELAKICRAESGGCRAIGAHGTRHNPAGEIYYRAGLRSRRLRPDECPAHGPASATTWGPRGPLGLALDWVWRHTQATPFQLVREGDSFFIDGLPPGRIAVEWDDSDPPGVARAYLKGYPLITGAGRSRKAAAEGLRGRLLKEAADPVAWLGALAEECRAAVDQLERAEDADDGVDYLDQIEGWQHLELAYRNAIRIVEAASAVAKAKAG